MKPFTKDASVGFIGLGAMGLPMAAWLRQSGWNLHIYARRDEPAKHLGALGATRSPTASDLGRVCDVVLLCLSDEEAVDNVLFGLNGLKKGMKPGSVIVDLSTIGADSARSFAQRLNRRDITYVDAPVSGGQKGAESGSLACMVGGSVTVVNAIRDVLGAFCKSVTHVGDVGSGQIVKACNQVAAAAALMGVADAIAIAHSRGVDVELMRQILLSGTARSFVLERDGQRIIDGNFEPGFRARLMLKDLRIALKTASSRTSLIAAPLAESLLSELCESGGSELDWSAVGMYSQRRRVD